jgi:hypothetical protein
MRLDSVSPKHTKKKKQKPSSCNTLSTGWTVSVTSFRWKTFEHGILSDKLLCNAYPTEFQWSNDPTHSVEMCTCSYGLSKIILYVNFTTLNKWFLDTAISPVWLYKLHSSGRSVWANSHTMTNVNQTFVTLEVGKQRLICTQAGRHTLPLPVSCRGSLPFHLPRRVSWRSSLPFHLLNDLCDSRHVVYELPRKNLKDPFYRPLAEELIVVGYVGDRWFVEFRNSAVLSCGKSSTLT